jgi:hypothetical protein
MDELLASALDAHGGLESRNRLTELTARLSLGGPSWSDRGWPGVYANQTVTVDAHRQHISLAPFTAPDRVSVLDVDPERVTIETTDGEIVEERTDPRSSYPLPFDRSKTNANHNPDQVFYVDENFTQRRMDYSPDVTGTPPVAHSSTTRRRSTGSCSQPAVSFTCAAPTASPIRRSRRSRSTHHVGALVMTPWDVTECGPRRRGVTALAARLRPGFATHTFCRAAPRSLRP